MLSVINYQVTWIKKKDSSKLVRVFIPIYEEKGNGSSLEKLKNIEKKDEYFKDSQDKEDELEDEE